MANFPGLILTEDGQQLQAKAQIGQKLEFTRAAIGSGPPPATPEQLTALQEERLSLSLQEFEVIGDGTSRIRAILTNTGLAEGFFIREIGVFARDPDTLEEHLYSYSNSDSQSDYLPAAGGTTIVEQIFDLVTVIGNATNVTAVIDDYITIATKTDIEEIRPYLLPTGGLPGQMLRKRSKKEGDVEWFAPGFQTEQISLNGPKTVYPGSSNAFTITDFDAWSRYTVEADTGVVSLSSDTVTLDLDAAESADHLTMTISRNGTNVDFVLAVGGESIAAPNVTNPVNGAINVGASPTATTNAFETYPADMDTHISTDWQLATDASFSNIIWQSLGDTNNLESISVPSGVLSTSTTYYIRTRHRGATLGTSNWSTPVTFKTAAQFVPDEPGTPFGGGYFVSRMLDEVGDEYALVISPKAEGELFPEDTWTTASNFVANLNSGGFNDWKLPDMDELRAIYWNLKAANSYDNNTNYGASSRIIPPTSNYTLDNPFITTAVDFRYGGPEALVQGIHWSSNKIDSTLVMVLSMAHGLEQATQHYSGATTRAVRRVYY